MQSTTLEGIQTERQCNRYSDRIYRSGLQDVRYASVRSGFKSQARPSMGKTAFVLNIAQYMAFRKDVTVAIFSLEMSKEQLVNRLLAMESHVD